MPATHTRNTTVPAANKKPKNRTSKRIIEVRSNLSAAVAGVRPKPDPMFAGLTIRAHISRTCGEI